MSMKKISQMASMTATQGKAIICKAAVVWEFKKPISIETVEVAPPKTGEVRVKIQSVGLCHSDLYALDGNFASQPLPFVIGHEGAGIVESIGDGVTSVIPGDKVFTLFWPQCRQCKQCQSRKNNLCEDLVKVKCDGLLGRTVGTDGTPRFTCKRQPVYHFLGSSSFAEYTVIPESSCVKVDSKTALAESCIMACGFSTGYGSSANAVDIQPGDKTAVWGMGGVGLACVLGCRDKNAGQIVGIDINPDKEQIAKKMGCTDFIALDKQQKPLTEILHEKSKVGFDYTFVCIGNVQAMEVAVQATAPGGTMVIVGVAPDTSLMKISPLFMLSSRRIIGALIGDYKVRDDLPKLVDRYNQGKLPLKDFITHKFKLEEINEAIDVMKAGKSIRSVITI